MKENKIKYAQLILKECLKLEENQPLLISASIEDYEFIRILAEEALKLGTKDLHIEYTDDYITHSYYKYLNKEQLLNNEYIVNNKYDEYAHKKAAFLMLVSETPNIMKDIDEDLKKEVRKARANTRLYFNETRDRNETKWCIACLPNIDWAKKVYPDNDNPLEELWNTIFEITGVLEENPIEKLKQSIKEKQEICNTLNNLKIKQLHYKNNIGTDFTVELFDKTIWCSGTSNINNEEVLVNYPSEEIFTSPNKYKINGVVKNSLPLSAGGVIFTNFKFTLKDGEIVNVESTDNIDTLKNLVYTEPGANYIGEIALVPYNSPISNKQTIFYETLLDENASCHLAFGASFTECYENGEELSEKQREEIGLNTSKTHIDFMIGTKDLEITATTYDNKTIKIFTEGNFSKKISNK